MELHVILSGEGASAEHPLHEYFVQRYEVVYTLILDAFEEAAEHGELREGVDCASAARTVIALIDGLQLQWLLHRERRRHGRRPASLPAAAADRGDLAAGTAVQQA